MASPLPKDLKERAEKRCAEFGYLEVCDPGTVLRIEGRTLVAVKDKHSGMGLWLELPDPDTHFPSGVSYVPHS